MKKNMPKLHTSGWKRRISLVLVFTMLCSTFMYQGWYNPKPAQAAITVQQAWTSGYNAAAFPTSFNVTVNAGSNRMLVVAVSSTISTAATQTCSVTYGGTALTAVNGDGTTSAQQHTWLFYLPENATLMNGTARPLVATVTGGATVWNSVGWTVLAGVDQSASPVRSSANFNSGATTGTNLTLSSNLTIGTGDYALDVVNLTRTGSATARTISAWATNWAQALAFTASGTTPAVQNYIGSDTTAASTDANHTASGTCLRSHTAMSIKRYPTFDVGNGTDPSSGSAAQGSTDKAMDSFTFKLSTGTGSVSTMTLTGSADFTSANVSAIRIYRDNGVIGTYEPGTDVLAPINAPSWAANVATLTFTAAESVNTTTANYLVVIDVASGATVGGSLSGTITAVTGTNLGAEINYSDASSAALTITRGGLGIGNSINPSDANAPQGSLKNAMDSFSLDMGAGSGTVNTLTLTGSTQFTSSNVSAIRVYRDTGVIGAVDVSDVQLATSTAWAANVATITITGGETVTTTVVRYLIAVDIASAATVGNTLSGTITASTGTGIGTPVYEDIGSGTLTVAAGGGLTIGNGTDPAAASAPLLSSDIALDAFTTSLAAGSGQITGLTLTGSANFTTTNIGNVKVFLDNLGLGILNGADILVPSTFVHAGTVATITFTNPQPVSTTTRNYLVAVDIKPGATVGQAFTGTITAVAGTGYASTTYSDGVSATLTIAKAVSINSDCRACHRYSSGAVTGVFYDGSARNTPPGAFVGSHETHVGAYGMACTVCHVTPAAFNHRNGTIEMASPINGEAGGAYGKGASWAQTNSPAAMTACSNIYCHSQGTGGITGDGRAISAPVTALNWGSADSCNSCHGYPPSYASGSPKSNSHGVHTTHCETCHNGTTTTGDTITNTTNHTNRAYNIAAGNGEAIASYTFAAGGGTCANISCHGGVAGTYPNVNDAAWGSSLDCTTCHNKAVNAPRANTASGGTVTSRRNVAGEFANTWSHKRSAAGAVTKYDCAVCHMEGVAATGQTDLNYHGNGYVELRDPDTGGQIMGVTFTEASGTWNQTTSHTGAGSYSADTTPLKFVRFSRDLGLRFEAESTANYTGGPLNWQVIAAMQINQCLKCHDNDGAASMLARVPGGSALKPFNTTITGHSAPYSSNGQGNVVDVDSSFATTNSAYHPITGRQNNSYAQGTMLIAPWNMTKTTGNNTSYGWLMTCWDCHAPAGASGAQTSTVTAHGAAATLRAGIRNTGNTAATNLCINCHATSYATTSGNHAAGSAFQGGNTNMNATTFAGCANCHAYGVAGGTSSNLSTSRPIRAEDVHGFNDRTAGTVGSRWVNGVNSHRPYAFIRNTLSYWSPTSVSSAGETLQRSRGCTGTGGTCDNNMSTTTTYGIPGGVY